MRGKRKREQRDTVQEKHRSQQTYTHTHTHTLSLSHTHIDTFPHTHTHIITMIRERMVAVKIVNNFTNPQTERKCPARAKKLAHTHTHTHTHTQGEREKPPNHKNKFSMHASRIEESKQALTPRLDYTNP